MDNPNPLLSSVDNEDDIPCLGSWKKTPRNWNAYLVSIPTGIIDPDEFWKDEPNQASEYANVYIPIEEFFDGDHWVRVIKTDVEEWLNKNAGPRRCFSFDWYQNTQDYDWYVRGEVTHNNKNMIQVCVRDLKTALLFKLTFGGK